MLYVDSDGIIHLTRGDTARFSITIDNIVSNEIYTVGERDVLVLTVKKRETDIEYLMQKRVMGSNAIEILPTDTNSMSFGKYVYDIQLTTEAGDVYTIIPPTTFELLKEVTY